MSHMFYFCESLIKLDLSSFDTQNVTRMRGMFCGCKSLVEVIRKNFEKAKIDSEKLVESKLAIIEI